MARFKTSVAQQTGVPEAQSPAWRSSRGAAKAAVAAKARTAVMVNCILKVGWLVLKKKEVLVWKCVVELLMWIDGV